MSKVVNNNPQFSTGQYIEKMPTGFANVATNWTKYTPESQIIRGTMTFNRDKLKELDPAYTGFTHIFVLRMPLFMEYLKDGKILDGYYEKEGQARAKYYYNCLKHLIEMGSTSYSGSPSLTMDNTEVNVGYSERNYAVPTQSRFEGTDFTIKCLETRGEPLRHSMEFYISSVFDPVGKFASMGGAINPATGKPLEPSIANYSFSIMIVQTDPSLLRIQNIDLWNNAMFFNVDRSNLDWEQGQVDIVQPRDIQFRGIYLPATDNELAYKKAEEMMKSRVLYYKRIADLTEEDLRLDSSSEMESA